MSAAVIRSTGKLATAYEKMHNYVARLKDTKQAGIERSVSAVSGVAGGMASGAIRGMGYAKFPKTDVDTDLLLGGLALVAGAVGVGGKQTDALMVFGIGMASGSLSRGTEVAVANWRASH
jgi:hypothetical protein